MKKLLPILIVMSTFSVSIFAQADQSHSAGIKPSGTPMQQDQFPDFQVKMENMKLLMARVRLEQDPKVREKLMQEHMMLMEHSMKMMNESKQDRSQMNSMSTDERMDMMNNRMDMMQKMMGQMMGQMNGKMSGGMGMGGSHM